MGFSDDIDNVQVPWERVPKYPLGMLPDPPGDYEFLGRPYSIVAKTRGILLPTLKSIAKFVLWGFDYGIDKRETIILALAKVNYWLRPEYQYHTQEELFDIERDGGPRLLRYTVVPTPMPVSRHYSYLLTEAEMRQLGSENYVRPADAPVNVPDGWLFQFLLPPRRTSAEIDQLLPPMPQPESPTEERRIFGDQPIPTQNPEPNWAQTMAHRPAWPDLPPPAFDTNFNPNPIREAIEKALIKICYKDLERHPHAPSKEPVATRTASSHNDLGIVQVGTFPTVAEVLLNPVTFQFDPSGFPYPYRGRGPIWADGSCVIDTTIVLGMLTMAGCTMVDRQHGMEERFSEIERAFIQVTNMNWDAFDDKVSIELRHSFFHLLSDHIPDIKKNAPVPVWATWAESTRNFAQFQIRYREHPKTPCQHCGYTENEIRSQIGNCLSPFWKEGDQNGVLMSTLISRAWGLNLIWYRCAQCNAPDGPQRHRLVTELPLRMVVSTSGGFKILKHTQNQTLVYMDPDGKPQTAVYRWLGGAYYQNSHVRVYWNDTERGEYDLGNLRKYDGEEAGGVIYGHVAPYEQEDRVPPEWIKHGIPIVIYERIINPTSDMLKAASQTVTEMANICSQNKPFLVSHYPWFPPSLEPKSPFLPLERILPDTGERFYEKSLVAAPEVQHKTPDANKTLAEQLAEWQMQQGVSVDPSLELGPEVLPTPMDPGALQRLQNGENLFTSVNDNPNDLINHPEMWPEGEPPHNGGTTTFPNLPKTPTMPGAAKSPYWSWMNFSPDKNNQNAQGSVKGRDEDKTVTVVNIRDDCRTGPSPYRLYRVPVKSIKAAMQRLKEKESHSPPKKRSRLEELKDEVAQSPKRPKRKTSK